MNHHLDTFGQTCFLSYEFSVLTDQLKWSRLESRATSIVELVVGDLIRVRLTSEKRGTPSQCMEIWMEIWMEDITIP